MKTSGLNLAIGDRLRRYRGWCNGAEYARPGTADRPDPAAQEPATTTPPRQARGRGPPAPTRDPHTPGYVGQDAARWRRFRRRMRTATSSSVRRTRRRPKMTVQEGVPQGTVHNFTMRSTDSKIYPGIAREPGHVRTADPNDPAKLIVNSHPAPYTRRVAVYVPEAVRARARMRRSSSARTGRTRCCSRRSTI